MSAEDGIQVLPDARILQRSPLGDLGLADQAGLLVPAQVERLGQLAAELLPQGVPGLVIGETRLDALLGYLVARARNIPVGLMCDKEGVGDLMGSVRDASELCLLTGVLQDFWMVDQFEGLCRRSGVGSAGAATLVSMLPKPDPRVRALVQI